MIAQSLLASALLAGSADANLSITANADAPNGVNQGFGQLVGDPYACVSENRQQDGSWTTSPGEARWHFVYALDGHAVQDFWYPSPESGGPPGINFRTYDAETNKWQMVWATASQARFDHFDATVNDDGHIVMTGHRWTRPSFTEHHSRITFHSITDDGFDWHYEAQGMAEGSPWNMLFRISCRR